MDTALLVTCCVFGWATGRLFVTAQENYEAVVGDGIGAIVATAGPFFFLSFCMFGLTLFCVAALAWLHPSPSYGWSAISGCCTTFFPVLLANPCAGWARDWGLPGAYTPINAQVFGEAKTWGAYYAVVGALFAIFLQLNVPWLRSPLVDYGNPALLLAIVLVCSLGAVWGDHGESYLKRQRGIAPGQPWWPWDQVDSVPLPALYLLILLGWDVLDYALGYMILMALVIHPVGNGWRYWRGKRDRIL